MEADYSVALQLMLKYPAPPAPHGPHTFVDDAIYLRDHPNAAGGVTIIFKYTGKSPAISTAAPNTAPRTLTPAFQGFGSLRQRTLGARSPLSTTARLIQQPGGVEALLQGATKNMLERGEKLGINQAVRDAVGEIRRNMQGLQEARSPGRGRGVSLGDARSDHSLALTIMEKRNRQLAEMLEESITNLKLLAASKLEARAEKNIETVEVAAAKIQFVKQCLEDPSLSLPEEEVPLLNTLSISGQSELRSPTVALDTTPVIMTSSAVDETRSVLSSPEQEPQVAGLTTLPEEDIPPSQEVEDPDKMDTDIPEHKAVPTPKQSDTGAPTSTPRTLPDAGIESIVPSNSKERPKGPIPTRSTLAQSSFAWMLEPDTTMSSSNHTQAFSPSRPSSSGSAGGITTKKRANPSRERNAFLFGEVVSDTSDDGNLTTDEIFGLKPIRRGS